MVTSEDINSQLTVLWVIILRSFSTADPSAFPFTLEEAVRCKPRQSDTLVLERQAPWGMLKTIDMNLRSSAKSTSDSDNVWISREENDDHLKINQVVPIRRQTASLPPRAMATMNFWWPNKYWYGKNEWNSCEHEAI